MRYRFRGLQIAFLLLALKTSAFCGELSITKILAAATANATDKYVQLDGSWTCWKYTDDKSPKSLSQKANFTSIVKLGTALGSAPMYLRVNPRISEWAGGVAPFSETTEFYYFSGDYWIDAVESMGPEGQSFPSREATVSDEIPAGISPQMLEVGLPLFLTNAVSLWGGNLLQLIHDPKWTGNISSDAGEYKIEFDEIGKPADARQTYYCHSEKGALALSRVVLETGLSRDVRFQTKDEYIVTQFQDVAGFAFPKQGEWLISRGGQLRLEYDYTWNSIVETGPDNPLLKSPNFSTSWRVKDERRNP